MSGRSQVSQQRVEASKVHASQEAFWLTPDWSGGNLRDGGTPFWMLAPKVLEIVEPEKPKPTHRVRTITIGGIEHTILEKL